MHFCSESFDIDGTVQECKRNCDLLSERVERQEDEIQNLRLANRQSKLRFEEIESYSRRNNIRIFGIDDPNRNKTANGTMKTVANVLKSNLKINVEETDIDIAHRLGPYNTSKQRPIIVKFVSRQCRNEVMRSR